MLIVSLYVDDKVYTANLMLEEFSIVIKKEFEMTNLGLMKYFLGLEVTQTNKGIFICHHKYATDILQRFRMDKCKPAKPPIVIGTKLTKKDDGQTVNSTL